MSTAPQNEFSAPDPEQMRVHRPLSGETVDNQKSEVESVSVHGREYLVFPVVAAREMVLDYPERNSRELLPRRHLQQSESLWAGTPLVFIHPENERRTADDPREYTQTIIGMAYQPEVVDKSKLRVMAYIDVEKARDIGGLASDVVDKLKSSEPLGVSAGYATLNDDHEGGKFNGEEYDVEQGYIVPDHIAIFPNDEFQARCDWEDGCGAPRVNYVEGGNENAAADSQTAHPDPVTDKFEDEQQARFRAEDMGCDGTHQDEDGNWMPCDSHEAYLERVRDIRRDQLTACELEDTHNVERDTAESVRTLINEYNRSDSISEFSDRLERRESVDNADAERVFTLLEAAPSADVTANLREGQYVQWDWSDGTAYGQVTEVVDEGTRSVEGNERSVAADDDQQIAVIEQYSQDGESQSQRVVKYISPSGENEDNLRSWDAPSAARENMPMDTAGTCPDCGCGPDEAHEPGCSHAGQSLEGGFEYTEGDLVEWIAFPDKKGQVEHIDHDREIAMVSLIDIDHESGSIERTSDVVSAGLEDLRLFAEQVNAKVNIPEDPSEHTLARVGEWVVWDERGSESYGQITTIENDGCLEVASDHKCVDESENALVCEVQRYSEDGTPRNHSVLKYINRDDTNEDGLRKWRPPRQARVNSVAVEKFEGDDGQQFTLGQSNLRMKENAQDDDPVSLLGRFLQSIGRGDAEATVNAAGAAEELSSDAEEQTDSGAGDTADEDEQEVSDESNTTNSDPEPTEGDEGEEDVADAEDTDSDTEENVTNTDEGNTEDVEETESDVTENAEDTDTDDGDTSDTQDMKENQLDELSLEQVAAKTAFGITELEEMDDQMLTALERTVQEMSDESTEEMSEAEATEEVAEAEAAGAPETAGSDKRTATEGSESDTEEQMNNDDSGTEDGSTDEQSISTDQFLTQEEAEESFATKDDLENVNNTLEEISSTVENIAEETGDDMDEEAQIVANAIDGMDVEAAKELPEEKLSELAEKNAPKANFSGIPGQAGGVRQNTQSAGEDADDYPAGGREAYEQRKAEGGD